jgi:hypothetical protein
MARLRTSSCFMMLRQWSRSLSLFLEKVCHRSSDFISQTMLTKLHTSVQYGKTSNEIRVSWCCVKGQGHCYYLKQILVILSSDFISQTILTKLHTSVRYGKTSNEFAFHHAASKVKVNVTIFVIALAIYQSHKISSRGDLYEGPDGFYWIT